MGAIDNIKPYFRGEIFFYGKFARDLFGISKYQSQKLTHPRWAKKDNSLEGAIKRLMYLKEYGRVPTKLSQYCHYKVNIKDS